MTSRVRVLVNRILEATGEAMSTPSGVNGDLLRACGRNSRTGLPHYYGNGIPTDREV